MELGIGVDWNLLNAFIQWVVIPLVVLAWRHNDRLAGHDKDITKVVTIIEQQEVTRVELRRYEVEAIQQLASTVAKLDARIDELSKELRSTSRGRTTRRTTDE